MDTLLLCLRFSLLLWIGLLTILITGRIASGAIWTAGMLAETPDSDVTPERVLAIAVAPAILLMYTFNALNLDVLNDPSLPDVPETFLAVLTGSNGLYLAGKIARRPGGTQ